MLAEWLAEASKTSGTSQDCPGIASVEIEGEELRLWLLQFYIIEGSDATARRTY
jgi:hypothetical protein